MNITHKTTIKIQADQMQVWEAITQTRFVQDFLPEVKKDLTGMGEYVRNTHQNTQRVLPAYAVTGKNIAWNAVNGTTIALPRKDTQANIEMVDIQLQAQGDFTKVTIEVNYNPKFGKNFFETQRCLRGLFGIKLNVLKQELEADLQEDYNWAPAFI